MTEIKRFILDNQLGKVFENKSFRDYTTIKVGGKIHLVYMPNTIENFLRFYEYFQKFNYPIFIIGFGSNVLASDCDFQGVVVTFRDLDVLYFRLGNKVKAYPGCSVVRLAYDSAKSGYSGAEFLSGIPATVGGAVYMNAGANGGEIKDILVKAKLLSNDEIKVYDNTELSFGYRKSRLQSENSILLEADFEFINESESGMALRKIIELKKLRRKNQPIEKLCAGCTFHNPPGLYAWQLIDRIGFRGYQINQAQVSIKHSNFLINNGNARSDDMIQLIKLIKEKVKERFDIDLECEWILVNFEQNF
ncbi:MAG: UDP-N-acetylmuramate dehydrogenase [Bacilli bacterium]|nr:UDP-N-acetylmuramate dehydrogenase [Bacilli bacterium]MDD4076740.1 UDP-N-acetylmuramate dehydrogenase [Bacilli bacterium]MDD4387830.1 UDP-N-acetylmuramate dehydrogenase [Bacilli bacterium]